MESSLPDFVAVDWIGTMVPSFRAAPYPGAVAALRGLHAAGVTVCVVSSASPEQLQADVERAGVAADEIIGLEDKAEAFSALRSRYGRGLVIGDQAADLRAARAAGLPFWQACLEGQPALSGRDGSFAAWAALDLAFAAA